MRLGGPVLEECSGPDEWVAALRRLGYGAAFCPLAPSADDATVRAYAEAAAAANIVIAETGAWCNPISSDDTERLAAIRNCEDQLALADRIGACCCVGLGGSRGPKWDGPWREDLTPATFDLTVETVRAIIDAVRPSRTYYTLETMPWMYPDSADSYLALIKAIDRPRFAVHLDVTNLVSSPRRYFHNADLIHECFQKLGHHVKSCHAKDVIMSDQFLVHLSEVRAGLGTLDYRAFLAEAAKLPANTPIMLEHLPNAEEYAKAAAYVRGVADGLGLAIDHIGDTL